MRIPIATLIAALTAGSTAFAQPGAWQVSDKTSALDGRQSYQAMLKAEGSVSNIIDRSQEAALGISCGSGGLNVTILWPDFIEKSDDSMADVVWKLDSGPVQLTRMFATSNLVGQTGRAAKAWIEQLSAGKSLMVRVPDRHGGQDVTFILSGIATVATTIDMRSCG